MKNFWCLLNKCNVQTHRTRERLSWSKLAGNTLQFSGGRDFVLFSLVSQHLEECLLYGRRSKNRMINNLQIWFDHRLIGKFHFPLRLERSQNLAQRRNLYSSVSVMLCFLLRIHLYRFLCVNHVRLSIVLWLLYQLRFLIILQFLKLNWNWSAFQAGFPEVES